MVHALREATGNGESIITAPISNNIATEFNSNGVVDGKDEDLVISFRGGVIENRHLIHAAIVDPSGKLLCTVGDHQRMTLARSSTKPIQTLAILETGAAERFDFDDADVALMCASHSSEPRHIDRARAILKKAGVKEEVLTCGGHPAQNPVVNRTWVEEGYIPTGIDNNCSGKHAGMVAGAVTLGASPHEYYMPEHPMQKRVYRAVEDLGGLPEHEVLWAIDGCNLPTPAMPLPNFALMFARLAEAADSSDASSDQRTQYLARIHKSMASYPGLVGGEGRFDTDLMQAYGGLLVGKIGADACYGIGIRASRSDGDSKHGAFGVAVKVEDGNLAGLYAAVIEILEQLEIGTSEIRQQLQGWHFPDVMNTAGVITGGFRHQFKVRSVAENS
jgi:L-asparaginase II